MPNLAIAVSDLSLSGRISDVMSGVAGVAAFHIGTDPWAVKRLVASRDIDALCFQSMSPADLLRTRRAIVQTQSSDVRLRTALLVDRLDSTVVYHALGYGIDDVIDCGRDDDGLRQSLMTFVGGTGRACQSMIAPTVPIPFPIVMGHVDYADEVDRRIVTLITVGYTDKEIADILHYSHQVIRNRVSHIMLRSGLRNRTQLASRHTYEAIEYGAAGVPFFGN